MKILIATHNLAKLKRYNKILGLIDNIEIVSLADINISEKVEENYATNTENALHKARIYGELSDLITVAADEALMTNFLPDNEQPGVYARRFSADKTELTDDEVIDVWHKIFEIYPQPDKQFIWSFAVAFYNPKTKSSGVQCVEQISYTSRYFSTILHPGYPMSSFLSSEKDGKPYTEMTDAENESTDIKNFANFVSVFKRWLEQNLS